MHTYIHTYTMEYIIRYGGVVWINLASCLHDNKISITAETQLATNTIVPYDFSWY